MILKKAFLPSLFAISICSGVFLGLTFLQEWTIFLLPFAWFGLLELNERLKNHGVHWLNASLYLYLFSFAWNLTACFWVSQGSFKAIVIYYFFNSFLMLFPLMLYYFLIIYLKKSSKLSSFVPFIMIFIWLSFEYSHYNWEVSWPWLNLGNLLGSFPLVCQWYEYTGVLGGTFWLLLVSTLLYYAVKNGFWYKIILVVTFLVPILISFAIYSKYRFKGKPNEVVLVQPNISSENEKYPDSKNFIPYPEQLKIALDEANKIVTPQTKFVLLPETAYPKMCNEAEIDELRYLRSVYDFKVKNPYSSLIMGVETFKVYKENVKSDYVRFTPKIGYHDVYNAAVLIDERFSYQFHRKSKLLLGGERIPFRKYSPYVEKVFLAMGSFGQYAAPKESFPLQNAFSEKVAVLICYESVFGAYTADLVKKGAEAIFIITNDGWWYNSPGNAQHLRYDKIRAIETRKDIARASNNGLSVFINQKGEITQSSSYGVKVAIKNTVLFNSVKTFYVKNGDWIGIYSVLTLLLLVTYCLFLNKK